VRALALGLLPLLLAACRSGPPPSRAAAQDTPPPAAWSIEVDANRCAIDVPALPPTVQRGVCLAHTYEDGGRGGYGTPTCRRTVEELRGHGVRWLSLTPFGYLPSATAAEVQMVTDLAHGENDARMHAELAAARELGLHVILKPHVWIAGGAWRGAYAPAGEEGWARFFESYERFILHYARMAATHDVEILVVGTELPTAAHEAAWRRIIAAIREVYGGELTYAANWDAAAAVPFWDAVDAVGVQFYPPLAEDLHASEAAMRGELERRLDGLGALSRRVDRPIILTEVGYKSIVGAEIHPHTWPERHGRPAVSEAAQARAYRRLFTAVAERPFIRGVHLWKWFTDPDTREEGADGFSPRGKQAEAVLRAAYGACDDG
jgi:hypothetical protein